MRRLLHGDDWWANPLFWVELFLIANLAFLVVDIRLAHAVNEFVHRAEWIPIVFSMAATILLLLAMLIGGPLPVLPGSDVTAGSRSWSRLARWIGLAVGWGSMVVGIAGLLWHLNADFFQQETIKNLVYTAPFAAPLTYTGLGFLLILNRMVDSRSMEWARWVVLLAAGGFMGNFVLSLADHAQNGFFYPSEWIGVVSGAVAVGFLVAMVVSYDNPSLLSMNLGLMAIQVVVGLLGFCLHARGNLRNQGGSQWDTFVYGAPIFAPFLFADLAVLAVLGLWAQARCLASAGRDKPVPVPILANRPGVIKTFVDWREWSGSRNPTGG
jgi:hypothetical protein